MGGGVSLLPGGGRQPHTHCLWMGRTPGSVPDADAARVSPLVPVHYPGAGGSQQPASGCWEAQAWGSAG